MKHSILNKKFLAISLFCIYFLLILPINVVNAKPLNDKAEKLYKEKTNSIAVFKNYDEKDIYQSCSIIHQINDYILSLFG
ncbi:hypothetical protein CLTEP_08630 [Clostridium tepidiprofundi DSM 19306]|uniref:Uncharacterized protein n=1 Tax=Clostridium tepidiprofundi DSM 19306 TaxID=1121338 RepID=A0A151B5P5_9CLOT|nr:hypothetical protein [Clostridium tepidiprofundi]KYH35238.1 hypothetical protein CLTEP_08630 [Clostridium tepidiprofundi DSM 19306]